MRRQGLSERDDAGQDRADVAGDASFEDVLGWLRAGGEATRLRLLVLLDRLDLTVSDLTAILGQSQPRVSRHLKLLVDAGLVRRFQEGAWAYFRAVDTGPARALMTQWLAAVSSDDKALAEDLRALERIRNRRAQQAADYFASNAEQWNAIRNFHVAEDNVEAAMLELGLARQPGTLLDLGTGTGRILQLFGPHVARGVGLDTSRDMLSIARSALEKADTAHLNVRYGDVYSADPERGLPADVRFDLIVLHQVLHFLEDPLLALRNAKGSLARSGRMLIVDFAPHDVELMRERHAHRRLGVSTAQLQRWCDLAGLNVTEERSMPPLEAGNLTVMLWLIGHSDDEGFRTGD